MRDINALRERPRFSNTLTTNCTTIILAHAAVNPGSIPTPSRPSSPAIRPMFAYNRGRLDRSLPFEELKRRAHINARGPGRGPGGGFLPAHPRWPAHAPPASR